MAAEEPSVRLNAFFETGIYRFELSDVIFIDPVRVLNRSYTRFRVSSAGYYTRFFDSNVPAACNQEENGSGKPSMKRKRKAKKRLPRILNDGELDADSRHQKIRPCLLKAHECLLAESELLTVMKCLRNGTVLVRESDEFSFVELGRVWQAPFYEIILNFNNHEREDVADQNVAQLFNSLVYNETSEDAEAEFLDRRYILPRQSCFYTSDLDQIGGIVPAQTNLGFNLILIDPPWENGSACQKHLYQTLPNRYFLSLPVGQLIHNDGALVALWVTNKEKLRKFVENELFPSWGVSYAATFYWLKVKPDGSLICELDLFHHRPYECLVIGYCLGKTSNVSPIMNDKTIISIPGDYSRKPPVGDVLLDHVPGFRPARCIELFAREMMAGWTSWGNEPLRFQRSDNFFSIL